MRPRRARCALYPRLLRRWRNMPSLFGATFAAAIDRRLGCPVSLPALIDRALTARPPLLYPVAGYFHSNNRKATAAWRCYWGRPQEFLERCRAFSEFPAPAGRRSRFVRAPWSYRENREMR